MLALISAFVLVPAIQADPPSSLITNIHPNGEPELVQRFPQVLGIVDGRILYSAADPLVGRELWISDGTEGGSSLVSDFTPGLADSLFGGGTSGPGTINGFSPFLMEVEPNSPSHRDLWLSDGTPSGTFLFLESLPNFSIEANFHFLGGDLWFPIRTPGSGREWWRTDGTAEGTEQMTQIGPGSTDGLTGFAGVRHGRLVFEGPRPGSPPQVDGVYTIDSAGSLTLLDLDYEEGRLELGAAIGNSNRFLLHRWTGNSSEDYSGEWIASDGTTSGTATLAAAPPFVDVSLALGTGAVILAEGDQEAWILLATDGTSQGTGPLLSTAAPVGVDQVHAPFALSALGDRVVGFVWQDGLGYELSAIDPVSGAVELLYESVAGPDWREVRSALRSETRLYVNFDEPPPGNYDLVVTDGSAKGTEFTPDRPLLTTAQNGPMVLGSSLVLAKLELTRVDPDASLTPLTEPYVVAEDSTSSPLHFTRFGTQVVFAAWNDEEGGEIWFTDGTEAGTWMLDLTPGPESTGASRFTVVGDEIAFLRSDGLGGSELWFTDGTPEGSRKVQVESGLSGLTPIDIFESRGLLYLVYLQGPIVRSDGTDAGTFALGSAEMFGSHPGFVGPFLGPIQYAPARDFPLDVGIFFSGSEAGGGEYELWASDGTLAGTEQVLDIRPGPGSSFPSMLEVSDGRLFMQAHAGPAGLEPFVTDGTPAGTFSIADVHLQTYPESGVDSAAFGGGYVFNVRADGNRLGPWFTDGTSEGTFPLVPEDVTESFGTTWSLGDLFATDELLAFRMGNGSSANGLWRYASGDPLASKATSVGSFSPFWTVASGGRVAFGASVFETSTVVGSEPQLLETTGAVVTLDNIQPGAIGSAPTPGARVGSRLVFAAKDPSAGVEPRQFALSSIGGWVAEPIGRGCAPVSVRTPAIRSSGTSTLGDNLTLELDFATPDAPVLWIVDDDLQLQPSVGVCGLLLPSPIVLGTGMTSSSGQSLLPLAIPNQPALVDTALYIQALTVEVGGPFLGVAGTSDGFEVVIGS